MLNFVKINIYAVLSPLFWLKRGFRRKNTKKFKRNTTLHCFHYNNIADNIIISYPGYP
jgi:hypothetical protein